MVERRTPEREVRGSILTQVANSPCCVLEQDTFTSQKYWKYPGSDGSVRTMAHMSEKLFTGMLSKNRTKQDREVIFKFRPPSEIYKTYNNL